MVNVREIKRLMIFGVLIFCCGVGLVAGDLGGNDMSCDSEGDDAKSTVSMGSDVDLGLEFHLRFIEKAYVGGDWFSQMLQALYHAREYPVECALVLDALESADLIHKFGANKWQKVFVVSYFSYLFAVAGRPQKGIVVPGADQSEVFTSLLGFAKRSNFDLRTMMADRIGFNFCVGRYYFKK